LNGENRFRETGRRAPADGIKMEKGGGGAECVKQSRGFPFGASGGVRSTGIPQMHYARKRRSGGDFGIFVLIPSLPLHRFRA